MDEADSNQLPEFSNPPVVEVALGVQFRPVYGLRPIELAILREKWRSKYPVIRAFSFSLARRFNLGFGF